MPILAVTVVLRKALPITVLRFASPSESGYPLPSKDGSDGRDGSSSPGSRPERRRGASRYAPRPGTAAQRPVAGKRARRGAAAGPPDEGRLPAADLSPDPRPRL